MTTSYDMAEIRMGKPLIFEIIQADIKKLVGADDLLIAAKLLAELVEIYDHSKIDEVVLLQACINRLEKKEREGSLDLEQMDKERNRLITRLQKIARSVLSMK